MDHWDDVVRVNDLLLGLGTLTLMGREDEDRLAVFLPDIVRPLIGIYHDDLSGHHPPA